MHAHAKLTGKRIAIFVDQMYQEMEVWYPYYRLIEEGAEVHLVGDQAGKTYLNRQGKLVAAICHGLWCCVSADVLRGRHCTSFFSIKEDVCNAGGLWEDSEVVVDANLVSSRKPDDLPAFVFAAIGVLARQ